MEFFLWSMLLAVSCLQGSSSRVLLQLETPQLSTENVANLLETKPKERAHAKKRTRPQASGALADLNAQGYLSVLEEKRQSDFFTFAKRVLQEMGLELVDQRRMMAKFVFTKPKTLDKLIEELLKGVHGDKFLMSTVNVPKNGTDPKLNEDGFKYVLQEHDDKKMSKFIQRLALSRGLQVVDKGGLAGMTPFYSGTVDIQSFSALEDELSRLAEMEHSWLKVVQKKQSKQGKVLKKEKAVAQNSSVEKVQVMNQKEVSPSSKAVGDVEGDESKNHKPKNWRPLGEMRVYVGS